MKFSPLLLLVIITLFLQFSPSLAQSNYRSYEIKYTFKSQNINGRVTSGPTVEGLILHYGVSGSPNTMRIRVKESEKDFGIYEWKIRDSLSGDKLFWIGHSGSQVASRQDGIYSPDLIRLCKETSTGDYLAEIAQSTTGAIADVTYFKPIDSLGNNLLSKYYGEIPKIQPNMGIIGDTIHLIQISSKWDKKLSYTVSKNENEFLTVFKEIAVSANVHLESYHFLNEQEFSHDNVMKIISTIKPGSDDAVIFYYSGHGFRYQNQTSKWPRLFMDSDESKMLEPESRSLSLDSSIYAPLNAKRPRLLIVIGECCNNEIPLAEPIRLPKHVIAGISQPAFINRLQADKVKRLLAYSGTILIATSSPGQFSYYDDLSGGIFGEQLRVSLIKALGRTSDEMISWETIINNAILSSRLDINYAREKEKQKGRPETDQVPIMTIFLR